QPQFAFISGAVNSDNAINAAAALVLLLLVRAMRRGLTVPSAIGLGAALVAVPFMKTTGYSLFAIGALGLAAVAWRHRGPAPAWLALAGTFLGLQAIWVGVVRWQVGPPPDGLVSANPDTVRAGISGTLSYTWQVLLPRAPWMMDLIIPRWPDYGFHVWVER